MPRGKRGRPTPTSVTLETKPGRVNFFAEMYTSDEADAVGLMLLQVQVHPLPADVDLYDELSNVMNEAVAKVLRARGLVQGDEFIEDTDVEIDPATLAPSSNKVQ